MGACASIHKSPRVVIVGIGSKAKRIFTASPTKEKPLNGKNPVGEFSFEEKHVEENHLGLKSPVFGNFVNLFRVRVRRRRNSGRILGRCFSVNPARRKEIRLRTVRRTLPELIILDFLSQICLDLAIILAGSKDEIFFDSRAWLDSDCEDDFFSVNGDFTPSRGSTPNHQIITPSTPRANVVISVAKFADPSTEPSPTSRKKLADLFREAKQVEKPLNEQNASEVNTYKLDSVEFLKPSDSNPYGFEFRTPSKGLKSKRESALSTLRCCLPISPQRIGFDERSAKMS